MKPPSKSPGRTPRADRRRGVARGALVGALLACVCASPARACGPIFPNRYLDAGAEQLLAAPEAYFADELYRLLPSGTPRVAVREYNRWSSLPQPTAAERSASADVAELESALRQRGLAETDARRLAEAYGQARASGGEAPAGTPAEFALYLRGAQAWKRGATEKARAAWREVLALPEADNRHRAVWAAYMLGRSHLILPDDEETGPARMAPRESEAALAFFASAEHLVAAGASDVLGLAGEAKGWRARLLAECGAFSDAVALYLERLAEGDDTAAQSLSRLSRKILADAYGENFDACVRDPRTRGVVVACMLARVGRPYYDWEADPRWTQQARRWALAIHETGVAEVRGADRLAWLAYEGGLFGLAADWLKIAPTDSAEADWLRSKLALRSGDAAEGARWLEQTLRAGGLHWAHRKLAWAELGRTRMALDQPQAAFEAFVRGDHWEDAAFVAERVLSVDELAALVDAAVAHGSDPDAIEPDAGCGMARDLLARRLAREDQGERALRYMPESERESFTAYLADVERGFDTSRPVTERAEALWRAARVVRDHGMNFFGAALEPDWAVWDGRFDGGSYERARLGVPLLEGGVFAPTAQEQARIRENPAPEKRFHYRYQAAELASWAASLMPDESDETARVLWEAGGWLKHRDPKAAEPFYQALVLRCGRTELGRAAKERRWFPREWPPVAVADGADAG